LAGFYIAQKSLLGVFKKTAVYGRKFMLENRVFASSSNIWFLYFSLKIHQKSFSNPEFSEF
jgi:hypothetical protein